MIKKYKVTVNGKTYDVEIEELEEKSSKQIIQDQPEQSNSKTQGINQKQMTKHNKNNIISPMAGTILNINIKVGDEVKKGQVLLILEAMKMENEIIAQSDGIISDINVSKGGAVNAGDVLVIIE